MEKRQTDINTGTMTIATAMSSMQLALMSAVALQGSVAVPGRLRVYTNLPTKPRPARMVPSSPTSVGACTFLAWWSGRCPCANISTQREMSQPIGQRIVLSEVPESASMGESSAAASWCVMASASGMIMSVISPLTALTVKIPTRSVMGYFFPSVGLVLEVCLSMIVDQPSMGSNIKILTQNRV